MDYSGIIIGAATFLTIGLFHPLVIKAEYYLGAGCWWLFLLVGLGCIGGSLFAGGVWSILLGVVGFSCLWSIHELVKPSATPPDCIKIPVFSAADAVIFRTA